MSELVEFLRARLDEDYEAVQRVLGANVMAAIRDGVPAPRWVPSPKSDVGVWDTNRQPRVKYAWPRERDHIIRHDPARVLAEVEAKRSVLARHHAAPVPPGHEWAEEYPYCAAHAYKGPDDTVVYPVELKDCPELLDLAAPYGRHPDYREEWRP